MAQNCRLVLVNEHGQLRLRRCGIEYNRQEIQPSMGA
jgi:hypothetical protein